MVPAVLLIGFVLAATAGLTAPPSAPGPVPTTAPADSVPVVDPVTIEAPPAEPALAGAAEAAGPTVVAFDGEGGGLGVVSSSANATVAGAAAKNGAGGLRLSSTEAAAYTRWGTDVVPQGETHATARLWVRVLSRGPGQSVDVFTIGNAQQTANFDFFVNGVNQRFQWDIWREDTAQSDFAVEYGRWYLVEAQLEFDGTQHTAAVRIDGVTQAPIASTGTSTTVRMLTLGTTVAKTHAQDYDDLEFRVDDGPMGWPADAPPSVGVTRPADGAVYVRGQAVSADYACSDGDHAVVSCLGPVVDGAAIDTATLGDRSFTVTATDRAGYTSARTHTYSVVDGTDPSVTVMTPTSAAAYPRGAVVVARFTCADDAGGSGLAPTDGCVGPVASGAPVDTMALGEQQFPVTATDNAGNTTTVVGTYTVVRNRPDAHIRRSTAPRFAGDGIYSPNGAGQTHVARVGPRGSAVFFVRLQNDGEVRNRFRVRGSRSDGRWTVRYFAGTRDVTRAVTTGTHRVDGLAPGGTRILRVVVRPTTRAVSGNRRDVTVRLSARTQPGVADTVRAVIRRA